MLRLERERGSGTRYEGGEADRGAEAGEPRPADGARVSEGGARGGSGACARLGDVRRAITDHGSQFLRADEIGGAKKPLVAI